MIQSLMYQADLQASDETNADPVDNGELHFCSEIQESAPQNLDHVAGSSCRIYVPATVSGTEKNLIKIFSKKEI